MAAYDRGRSRPTRELQERTRVALGELMAAFTRGDPASAERLLADSVTALSDGGGEFFAARVPIHGPVRVTRFHVNITRRRPEGARFGVRMLNGLPAVVAEFGDHARGEPPRTVLACEIDRAGKITWLYSVVATRKLSAVRF